DGGAIRARAPAAGEAAGLIRPRRDGDALLELIRPADRVVMFGLGHVARAIGPLVAGLGFEVCVCDDGETGAIDARPPWAGAVILAAGAGRRLGGAAKALLSVDGTTFLANIDATMRAAGGTGGVVVVGEPHAAAVPAAARALGLEVATNPDPARGMASSVAV